MGNFLQSLGIKKKTRPENRTIYVYGNQVSLDDEVLVPEKYPPNRVVSSKYTAYNFIPKNLFEQFQRVANFYFLVVAIIQLFIDSPVSPVTSIVPLIFVVAVTAIKQAYEDILRHRADNEVNKRPSFVIRDSKLVQIRAMDIRVGDIVKVQADEGIPCDMVMLSSHDEDGECSITTANLDGETNLKTYLSVPDTRHLQDVESFTTFFATIECQQPITDLYRFIGRIIIHNNNNKEKITRPLAADNVLLRGSRLKNTPYVFGCAVYTGPDTKVSLNSESKGRKYSRVEKAMNKFLIFFLLALVVEAGLLTGLKHWWYSDPAHTSEKEWYRSEEPEAGFKVVVEEFLSFMVLLNYIIPVSMYVTVELQKFFGAVFFELDVEMYDAQTNEHAKANTSDLNEELGQVEHLFTDKTGTLTENDMQFRQCSVNGVKLVEVGGILCVQPDIPNVQPAPISNVTPEMLDLFNVLVLCHTSRVDKKDNLAADAYSETGFEYEYQSSSPDEKALVEACRRFGLVYHGVRHDRAEVTFRGRMMRYKIHHVLDFDPTRKRMSVIIEDENGDLNLLCKGAETAVLGRCTKGDVQTTEKHVVEYAMLGLRTLCIAQKPLTQGEFKGIDQMLSAARNALDDRDGKLAEAFSDIESGMTLLGATAVEDRLQDGVPETIVSLREAGIKVWVLTGDKEETAVNISYSAGHFQRGFIELRLTKIESQESCEAQLFELKRIVEDSNYDKTVVKYAFIVDGMSLAIALRHYADDLRYVCRNVVTVLCCRMSPLQKAQVVWLMKTSPENPTTAAIGDGANDVSMIHEAHVGIGIMGKEGRQAVRCSDYAFGRFRFLKRTLLVHGHYFYIRLATLVQYSFFKNVAFITAQLYFAFFSAFSAQTVFETMQLTVYNITFTSLPILLYGIFERHIPDTDLMANPPLYKTIRKNQRLSIPQFAMWNFLALYHSVIYFFGCYAVFYFDSPLASNGLMYGVYELGTIIYTCTVLGVNIKLMLEWYNWNWVAFAGFGLTFVGFYAMMFVYTFLNWSWLLSEYAFYGVMVQICSDLGTWIVILLVTTVAVIPDILVRAWRDIFSPMYSYRSKAQMSNYQYGLRNSFRASFTKSSAKITHSRENIMNDDNVVTTHL